MMKLPMTRCTRGKLTIVLVVVDAIQAASNVCAHAGLSCCAWAENLNVLVISIRICQ